MRYEQVDRRPNHFYSLCLAKCVRSRENEIDCFVVVRCRMGLDHPDREVTLDRQRKIEQAREQIVELLKRVFRDGDKLCLLGVDNGRPDFCEDDGNIFFVVKVNKYLYRSNVWIPERDQRCSSVEVQKTVHNFERAVVTRRTMGFQMFPRYASFHVYGHSFGKPALEEKDMNDVRVWVGTQGVILFYPCFLHDVEMMFSAFYQCSFSKKLLMNQWVGAPVSKKVTNQPISYHPRLDMTCSRMKLFKGVIDKILSGIMLGKAPEVDRLLCDFGCDKEFEEYLLSLVPNTKLNFERKDFIMIIIRSGPLGRHQTLLRINWIVRILDPPGMDLRLVPSEYIGGEYDFPHCGLSYRPGQRPRIRKKGERPRREFKSSGQSRGRSHHEKPKARR